MLIRVRYRLEIRDTPADNWRPIAAADLTEAQAREYAADIRQAGAEVRIVRIEEHVDDD